MRIAQPLGCLLGLGLSIVQPLVERVQAQQVLPDGEATIVTRSHDDFTIQNGQAIGNNLFHRFSEFSIPTGGSAQFDLINTPGISTIFSRVTGPSPSQIDGAIRILNSSNPVNLFLLNPAGLIFGPNASLDIGGSFVGSTASTVLFDNGDRFGADEFPQSPLSLSIPIGLQLGTNPGGISITQSTLAVQPGQAFLLIGGELSQSGGSISSSGGPIGLASLGPGILSLDPNWHLGFNSTSQFRDIHLGDRAYINSNGEAGGPIQLIGKRILVGGYSIVESVTQGAAPGGQFTIDASERLDILDVNPDGSEFSYVQTFTTAASTGRSGDLIVNAPHIILDGTTLTSATNGAGRAGDLSITAQQLALSQGAQIGTFTFAAGDAGNLTLNVSDSIDIIGFYRTYIPAENLTRTFSSGLYANLERGGTGNGGTLLINTNTLKVRDGGRVTTSVDPAAQGQAGNLEIHARDILIDGVNVDEVGVYSGILANIPAGTSGSSGTLKIEADRLTIRNGGQLSTANLGSGIAGGIDIKAGIIDIAGASQDGQIPSRISASSASDFAAGFVQIEADRLSLADRAVLSVSSLGSGEAGNLIIRANHIQLNNGSLQAESSSGTQGNIQLTVANSLLLNHSNITTNAYGTASGGNITITAPAIVGVNNSDIIANAIQGQGGTIQITTQGLFGLKFRNKTTSESDITASSERGNNGTIQVNDLAIDFNAGLVELPAKLLDQTPITTSCNATQGSQLLLAGNGGLPPSPITYSTTMQPWRDRRDNLTARSASPPTIPSIINATAWKTSDGGQIELIASQDASPMHPGSIACQDRGSSQKTQPKVAEFPQKR